MAAAGEGGEGNKNAVSPFVDASGKQISVPLSALVERFGVSRMRDKKNLNPNKFGLKPAFVYLQHVMGQGLIQLLANNHITWFTAKAP